MLILKSATGTAKSLVAGKVITREDSETVRIEVLRNATLVNLEGYHGV